MTSPEELTSAERDELRTELRRLEQELQTAIDLSAEGCPLPEGRVPAPEGPETGAIAASTGRPPLMPQSDPQRPSL